MKTIAQQLNIKNFPFVIKDDKGKEIYYEDSNGYWVKYERDSDGNQIYFEDSDRFWYKREYDADGNEIYYENSTRYWEKRERDSKGKRIYYENSDGFIIDKRPKEVVEMTMAEINKALGKNVKVIEG